MLYQVISMRIENNIFETDVTIRTFDSFNEAKKFFEEEKIDSYDSLSENSDNIEILNDDKNLYCIYDEDNEIINKIALIKIQNGTIHRI